MNTIETVPYKGYDIQINYDPDPFSPRDNENLCEIYSSVSYFRGDGILTRDREKTPENHTAHKLYYYKHSGITVSLTPFSDNWDSGIGGIVIRPNDVSLEQMEAEVEMYNHYLRGECYEYVILKDHGTCFNCKQPHVEEIDRAGGFLGDQAYCIEEAKAHIDVLINSLKLLKETK